MDPIAMMDFFGYTIGEVERMVLVLSRISGLFLSAPFFSRAAGPARIKSTFAIVLTLVIFPVVPAWPKEGQAHLSEMIGAGLVEVLIGAIIGMMVHWVLVAAQVAGSVIGFQMGLSMAKVMDPTSGMQEGVISNLLYLVGLMLFLIIDGHHLLLEGIARSFHSLPIGSGLPPADTMLQAAIAAVVRIFQLALLISAPVIGATKLLYLGMGLINKASPQVQVFFLAMPIAQMIGFVVLGMIMVVYAQVMMEEMNGFFSMAFKVVGM